MNKETDLTLLNNDTKYISASGAGVLNVLGKGEAQLTVGDGTDTSFVLTGSYSGISITNGDLQAVNVSTSGSVVLGNMSGVANVTVGSNATTHVGGSVTLADTRGNAYFANGGGYSSENTNSDSLIDNTVSGDLNYLNLSNADDPVDSTSNGLNTDDIAISLLTPTHTAGAVTTSGSLVLTGQQGNIGITANAGTFGDIENSFGVNLTANATTLDIVNSNVSITGVAASDARLTQSSDAPSDLYSHITVDNVQNSKNFFNYTATAGSLADIKISDGYAQVNMNQDSGSYTKVTDNFQNGGAVTINDFSSAHGEILATGLTALNDVAIDYVNGGALIHEAGNTGSIFLADVSKGSINLMTALNGTDFSQQTGSNTLLIAPTNPS